MTTAYTPLRFYTDRHIDRQVAIQLRAKGVDVIRCEEVGLGHSSDEVHWNYCLKHKLSIITKDDDFIKLHATSQKEGRSHFGIFFCPYRDQPAIGLIVQTCLSYHEMIVGGAGTVEDDIVNHVYFMT